MKKGLALVMPLVWASVILGSLAFSIHLYRQTYRPGTVFSPAVPRMQRPFDFQADTKELGSFSGRFLLLSVKKERNALWSTRYWIPGLAVLEVPVQVTSCGVCVRLALWDAGEYSVALSDPGTGRRVFGSSLKVVVPLSVYRNDFLLLGAILTLSFLSGRLASWTLFPFLPQAFQDRKKFGLFVAGLAIFALGLILFPYPETAAPRVHPMALSHDTTFESEGRPDAVPAFLGTKGEHGGTGGVLRMRHHMDNWTEFGRTLTFFEGPVGPLSPRNALFLPPDDGRYFLTLWHSVNPGSPIEEENWHFRAHPVSPPFPAGIYLGLALLSFAGFARGILPPARRETVRSDRS